MLTDRSSPSAISSPEANAAASAAEHSPDGLVAFDRHSRIVYCNASAARMFEVEAGSIIGKSLQECPWTPLDSDGQPLTREERPLEIVSTRRTPLRDRRLVVRKADGSEIVVSFNGDPVTSPGGEWEGAVFCLRDITERHRAKEKRRRVNAGISASTGQNFFNRLVRHLSESLPVPYAFVGEFVDESQSRLRTLAVRADGHLAENFTYDLHGTPCERVVRGAAGAYPDGVRTLFPEDPHAVGMGVESYVGTLLRDASGRPLGLLGVMGTEPMTDAEVEHAEFLLGLFVDRAAGEVERTRGEAALRDSEARFRALFDASPVGIAITRRGRYLYVNDTHRRMYGIPAGHPVAGDDLLRHVADGSRDAVLERYTRRERGEPVDSDYEVLARRVDGSTFPVHIHAGRIQLADGPANIAFIADITDRHRAVEALRHSETRYRRLVETNVLGVLFWDTSGRITGANNAFLRMTGYTREDLDAGRLDWSRMTPPELGPLDRRGINELHETGICSPFEKEYFKADGSRLPVLVGAAWLEGSRTEGVCYVVDLTERKTAEAAVRQSEVQFRTLFQASPIAIGISRAGQYILVNENYRLLFGYPGESSAEPHRIVDDIAPEARELIADRNRRRETDENVLSDYESVAFRRDGSRFPMHVRAGRIQLADGPATIAFIQDITERERLKERLLESQKLEAVGVLAGGIAHDFNNLLAVIMGYGESLVRQLGPEHPLAVHAQEIQNAAERGGGLVGQLLAFSRRQPIEPRVVDLSNSVRGLQGLLRRVISHEIRMDAGGLESGLFIEIDPGKLEQIVMNLALNARDAMPTGGVLTFAATQVRLDSEPHGPDELPPGGYARLSVSDTGVGIDDDTRRRIFEPFFSTKGLRGTGLGLSIVYGIVKQYGGSVTLESQPHQGSRFDILLPAVAMPVH